MRKFWAYFKLRLIMFISDINSVFFSYVFPLIMIVGLGFFFINDGNEKIKFYYNNANLTEVQKSWISSLKKEPLLNVQETNLSLAEAQKEIDKGKMRIFLEFSGGNAEKEFKLYYNRNGNQSEINIIALNTAVHSAVNNEDTEKNIISYYKKTNSYIYVIFPGGVGLVLWMISMLGTGSILIEERKFGVLKKLKTLDSNPGSYILSICATRIITALSLVYILLPLTQLLFGIVNQGSIILLSLVVIIGCIAFLGLSLFLANVSAKPEDYNNITQVAQIPIVVLGGVFFSIDTFPPWLQTITNFSPLTAFVNCFKLIVYEGIQIGQIGMIMSDLIVLSGWAVVFSLLGLLTFKWK